MDQAPLSLAFVRRLALVLVFSIMGCAQEKGVHLIANISAVSPLDPEDARGILTRFRDERSEFYDYLERLPARDAVILEYGSDGGYEACAILKTSSRKYRVVTSTAQLFGRPVQEWRRFVMAFDDDSGWAASSLECLRKSLAKDIAALIKKAPRRDTDHVEWMLVSLFSGESSCAMLVESQSLLWPLDPELGNSSSAEARSLASRLSEMMET